MKKILTVAKLTFLTPFKQGGGWALYLLLAIVATFMFVVSRSDGVLVNELRLRIRFALLFPTALLSLSLLWYACVSMRRDIDTKRMHLLTAYPIKRVHIFLGKWLGLLGFGGLGFLATMLVVGLAAMILIQSAPANERKQMMAEYYPLAHEVRPYIPDARKLARETLDDMMIENRLTAEQRQMGEKALLDMLRKKIVRKQQLVPRNGSRSWKFSLGHVPRNVEHLVVEFRCYAHDRRAVQGEWTVYDKHQSVFFRTIRRDRPFQTNQIRVPMKLIPDHGEVLVQFRGQGNQDLVFNNKTGIKVLYRKGSWFANLPVFMLSMLGHFALVIGVGLTIATAFTLSVASFVSMVLYFIALGSEFFQRAIRSYILDGEGGLAERFAEWITRIGLFFVTGMEIPAVIGPLSSSVFIGSNNIGMGVTRGIGSILLLPLRINEALYQGALSNGFDLLTGYLCYVAIVFGFGIWLFSRKELDRIH